MSGMMSKMIKGADEHLDKRVDGHSGKNKKYEGEKKVEKDQVNRWRKECNKGCLRCWKDA